MIKVPPSPLGVLSKVSVEYLKIQIVLIPTCTMFVPMHAYIGESLIILQIRE
jgi:hypothetical protein